MDRFITAFEKAVINNINKHNYCHLTGGYDTRTILSILLNKNIPIKAVVTSPKGNTQNDYAYASMIAKAYHIPHMLVNGYEIYNHPDLKEKDTTVFSGAFMSEYLNKYNLQNIRRTYQKGLLLSRYPGVIHFLRINPNLYFPMIDGDVIRAYEHIKRKHLHNSIVQVEIIRRNCPELLEIPFTKSYWTYGYKHYLRKLLDVMYIKNVEKRG